MGGISISNAGFSMVEIYFGDRAPHTGMHFPLDDVMQCW